jgi:hypothetical protein
LPIRIETLLRIGRVVFSVIATIEAMAFFLAIAYYGFQPDLYDWVSDTDGGTPFVLMAIVLGAIAVVFSLGVFAAWMPRFPLRRVVLVASVLIFVLFHLAWVVPAP